MNCGPERHGGTGPRGYPGTVRRRVLPVLLAALATVATLGAACTGKDRSGAAAGGDARGPGSPPPPSAHRGPAGPDAGPAPALLRFDAAGLDGSRVNGADFAGKDVAMWFWAPW